MIHTNAFRKNNLLFNTFLIYFVCIFLPTSISLECLYFSRIQKQEDDYIASYTDKALHVTQMLEEQFSVINATSDDFYLTSWYKKFISKSDVFQSEFNIVKKINIVQDLSCRVALLPLVEDILIINTENQNVICKYGWFSDIDKYNTSYVPLNLSALKGNLKSIDLFMPIKAISETYQVISYPDFNLGSTGRIAILMKNEAILDYLQSIEFNTFTNIRIFWNPDELPKNHSSNIIATTISSPRIDINFEYPEFRHVYTAEILLYSVSLFFLAVVVSALLAALFSFLFSHPLQELISSLALSEHLTHQDAYRNISEHIESINRKNDLMALENTRLKSEANTMVDIMRSDLMLHAMKGESIYSDLSYFEQIFPKLRTGNTYYLIILQKPNPLLDEVIQDHFLYLSIFDGYCGYLIWPETTTSARAYVLELLQEESNYACSQEYQGIENLTVCYRDALEQASFWHMPVTLSDSIMLLDSVRNADCASCMAIIEKYKSVTNNAIVRRWIVDLLYTRFDQPGDRTSTYSWADIEEMIHAHCVITKPSTTNASTSVIVSTMTNMIHNHYEIPDLSLKYFSNQFDISVSSLSKLFSQVTGENFSTTLQNVRMEKARELLQESHGLNIADIAVACGYENYLSFKRAFTRCEGISPREYRDIHK